MLPAEKDTEYHLEVVTLARWGRMMAVHRRRVVAVWVVAMLICAALVPVFFAHVKGFEVAIPGSESSRAAATLSASAGFSERAALVLRARQPDLLASAARRLTVFLNAGDGVHAVLPLAAVPTRDPRTGVLTVLLEGDGSMRQKTAGRIQDRVDEIAGSGVTADLTGTSAVQSDLKKLEQDDIAKAEAVGLPVAAVILTFAFGAVVAAGLTLLVALVGILATFGVLGALSAFHDFNTLIETMVVMVGLGVGIDYALLIVRRFREERVHHDPGEAMEITLATAGHTVLFSGTTVAISAASLCFAGPAFFTEMAVALSLVIALMVIAALTLVPAASVALGPRLDRFALPQRKSQGQIWARWAQFVLRRPWSVFLATTIVLVALALPALGMRTGLDLNLGALRGSPAADGLSTLQRAVPDGVLQTVDVVIAAPSDKARHRAARAVETMLREDRRVTSARVERIDDQTALVTAAPRVEPGSAAASRLVNDTRSRIRKAGISAEVGGAVAEASDYQASLKQGTPIVVIAALFLCFMVLLAVLRAPLLAVKAVLANLLSIAASFGLLVTVFQHGFGSSLLGFSSHGFIQSYTPIILFVIVYGLSMDYEVFIVTRMREEWQRTGDTDAAIAFGLQKTAGVVTSAAAIMIVVFSSFMLTGVPEIKEFGFGMVTAIAIDATLVRAALVPAAMAIAGRWIWWSPRWPGGRPSLVASDPVAVVKSGVVTSAAQREPWPADQK